MNRKSKLLILVLIIALTAGIVWWAIATTSKKAVTEDASPSLEKANAVLSFNPSIKKANPDTTITEDITYDSGNIPTKSITLSIKYDPTYFSNVTLKPYKDPKSALSYSFDVLPTNVYNHPEIGVTTLVYTLTPGARAQKGGGIIAKLNAKVLRSPAVIYITSTSGATSSDPSTVMTVGRVNLDVTR